MVDSDSDEDGFVSRPTKKLGRPAKNGQTAMPRFYKNEYKNRAFISYLTEPHLSIAKLAARIGVHEERLREWKAQDNWIEKRWRYYNDALLDIFSRIPTEDAAIVSSMKLIIQAEKNLENMLKVAGTDYREYPKYQEDCLDLVHQCLKIKRDAYRWLQMRKPTDPLVGR